MKDNRSLKNKHGVTFSLFKRKRGERYGKEHKVNNIFSWGGLKWIIPSIYVCGKGLVLDIFAEIDSIKVKDYIARYEEALKDKDHIDEEMQAFERRNPFNFKFNANVTLNGKKLLLNESKGDSYICSCQEYENEEMEELLNYYGLPLDKCYLYRRIAFPYVTKNRPKINTISLELIKADEDFYGETFYVNKAGDRVNFIHPITQEVYSLMVIDIKSDVLSSDRLDASMPKYLTQMTYALTPDLSDDKFRIYDTRKNDEQRLSNTESSAIGIIGGADGPTAICIGVAAQKGLHIALSAFTHTPQNKVCWQPVFRIKTVEDRDIRLI